MTARGKAAVNTVALADGTPVPSSSDAWRLECLARHRHVQTLLSMRGAHMRHQRQQYLAGVAAAEGDESCSRLKLALQQAWQQQAAGEPGAPPAGEGGGA